jgi:hypothetical protein
MKIELNDFWRPSCPSAVGHFSVPSFSIIALATWSLVRDQMSTTLL